MKVVGSFLTPTCARLAVLGVACVLGCNTKSPGERAKEELAVREVKKQVIAAPAPTAAPKGPVIPELPMPYDVKQARELYPEGRCPPGIWALFNLPPPGQTPGEKKANLDKKKEIAKELLATPFVVRMVSSPGVVLQPFDAPSGKFTAEVAGGITCGDASGKVVLAWAPAKAVPSGPKGELSINAWVPQTVRFEIPMESLSKAKEYYAKQRLTMTARVAFTLGPTKVDVHMVRTQKQKFEGQGEKIEFGGGKEDWGAGRLVMVNLVGMRVATDNEQNVVYEKKAP